MFYPPALGQVSFEIAPLYRESEACSVWQEREFLEYFVLY